MSNDIITVPFINSDEAFELQSTTLPTLPPAAKRLVLLHWDHRCPFHGPQRVDAEVVARIDQEAGDDLANLVPVCPECATKHEAMPFTAETQGKLREFARVFVEGLAGLRLVPKHGHEHEPEVEPEGPAVCHHHERHEEDIPEGHKRCSHCGEVLPVEQFARDRSRKDGLESWCRSCRADYRAANKAKHLTAEARGELLVPASKVCPSCGIEKPASEFPRARHQADGLHSQCKSCESERQAVYRARIKGLPASPQPTLALSLAPPSAPDLDPLDHIGRTNGFRALAGRSPIKLG